MNFTPKKINIFLLFNLPSAFISGVRLRTLTEERSEVFVRYQWINKNPFGSLYWATQGMASELATGVLVMRSIAESKKRISMLVTQQKGTFFKKGKGKVLFSCDGGEKVKKAIQNAIDTQEGQVLILKSKGVDEAGDVVSEFEYTWGIKVKA